MSVLLSGPPRGDRRPKVDTRLLRARAARVLRALERSEAELSIALVDDDQIRELNATHRGNDAPTDVLSFSLLEGAHSSRRGRLLGDVVIGVQVAARRARAAHRGLDDELAKLLIHGTLHLLGWDHQDPAEALAMRAEERRLWRTIRR